ncbi:CTLH/CRA C-terminal to lish motif domain-containing protein [Gaertneriomyces semiglobifer]|nr:CTLH/CRA C-terminal to lish motif domain-containing protein [Gaertneriomyces semiglobifer]
MVDISTEAPQNQVAEASDSLMLSTSELVLPPGLLQSLIHEYLVHNCYSDSARVFCATTQPTRGNGCEPMDADSVLTGADEDPNRMDMTMIAHPPNSAREREGQDRGRRNVGGMGGAHPPGDIATKTMAARKRLYDLVVAGKVSEAIEFCHTTFPTALDFTTPDGLDVLFELHTQQFIELVKESATDALRYAHKELTKFGHLNPNYMDSLNDILPLIAYADPATSPLQHYLQPDRRQTVAINLNNYILAHSGLPPIPTLEQLVRQMTVVRDLHSNLNPPKNQKQEPKDRHKVGHFVILRSLICLSTC